MSVIHKKRRGLVIIYDPHSLQQFIWYYCTYKRGKDWDAICLPNGYKGTYMDDYCRKSGIFSKIFTDDTDFLELPYAKKARIFIKLVAYYVIGQRKQCCKSILNEYVGNIDQYDELAAICDIGFISGLFALLGREKRVIYFDDGSGDYNPRSRWKSYSLKSIMAKVQGFLLSWMGYSCYGRFYFEPTKYCYKFSAATERMKYRNYRKMLDLNISKTDTDLYNKILDRVYPEIKQICFDKVEAVFFTDNLSGFTSNYQAYCNKCARYIGQRYKNILLKKHPRDFSDYEFGTDVKVQEVNNEIPAEILFSYLKGKPIYFMISCSMIIFMRPYHYNYKVFYFESLYKENSKSISAALHYHSDYELKQYCERFSTGEYEIIKCG